MYPSYLRLAVRSPKRRHPLSAAVYYHGWATTRGQSPATQSLPARGSAQQMQQPQQTQAATGSWHSASQCGPADLQNQRLALNADGEKNSRAFARMAMAGAGIRGRRRCYATSTVPASTTSSDAVRRIRLPEADVTGKSMQVVDSQADLSSPADVSNPQRTRQHSCHYSLDWPHAKLGV